MQQDPLVFAIFLIFSGAAVVATLALYARQALLVAYILLGVLFGPSVLGLVSGSPLLLVAAAMQLLYQGTPFVRLTQPVVAVRFATIPAGQASGGDSTTFHRYQSRFGSSAIRPPSLFRM